MGYQQVVLTRISDNRTWRLISVFNVRLQDGISKLKSNYTMSYYPATLNTNYAHPIDNEQRVHSALIGKAVTTRYQNMGYPESAVIDVVPSLIDLKEQSPVPI